MKQYAAVVGGVNVDMGGISRDTLRVGDSNPGRIRLTAGGVGRNIAQNLCQLGIPTELLTAFGEDALTPMAKRFCTDYGIGISHAKTVPGGRTSAYLYLCGPDGEMQLAVSDMDLCGEITPEYLQTELNCIREASLLIVDANLSEDALRFLGEQAQAPIFADPVSTAKAGRLRPILSRIHTLKPNRLEAELLTGIPIRDEADERRAAEALLAAGVQRVFLSLGERGVLAAEQGNAARLTARVAEVKNVTGAGDTFMAALGWAWMQGMDLRMSAEAGCAAAACTVECSETVSPFLNGAVLRSRMRTEEIR